MIVHTFYRRILLAGLVSALSASTTMAATANYGNRPGQNGIYEHIAETSQTDPVPLFGPPTAQGDSITFDTAEFSASATDGNSDITAATLEFSLQADPGFNVDSVELDEMGDWLIVGEDSSVSVDGTLTLTYYDEDQDQYTTLADSFDVDPEMPREGTSSGNWEAMAGIDLSEHGVRTDHVRVVLDNILFAGADEQEGAFMDKKVVNIDTEYTPVPEPASMALLALGLPLVLGRGRRPGHRSGPPPSA